MLTLIQFNAASTSQDNYLPKGNRPPLWTGIVKCIDVYLSDAYPVGDALGPFDQEDII